MDSDEPSSLTSALRDTKQFKRDEEDSSSRDLTGSERSQNQPDTSASSRDHQEGVSLRWSFGQRPFPSEGKDSQNQSQASGTNSSTKHGSPVEKVRGVLATPSSSNMTSTSATANEVRHPQAAFTTSSHHAPSSPRFPSPSKNSTTSDEEGMIKEGETEEGEVEEGEAAGSRPSTSSFDHRRGASSNNHSNSANPNPHSSSPYTAQGRSGGPPLSERFSATPMSSHAPPRRWGSSAINADVRSHSSGSRDLSRGDSYQPARYRSPDRDRDWDGRSNQTPLRFPASRSYEDSPVGSSSSASSSAPPPPLPYSETRGPIRGIDSYRPGSNALPSRPPVAHRTTSSGSLADDTNRSLSRRDWEREKNRDRDRDRTRNRDRRSMSPSSSRDRDDLDRDRRGRWRSGPENGPPSPTSSHHSLPPPPRIASGTEQTWDDDDGDLRRGLGGSSGNPSRANSSPWVAGANAQQIRYNRWGLNAQPNEAKRERFSTEERSHSTGNGGLSSRLSEPRTNSGAMDRLASSNGKSRGMSQLSFDEEDYEGSRSAQKDKFPSRSSSPGIPATSPVKLQPPPRPTFEPPRSDSGWGARGKQAAYRPDTTEQIGGEAKSHGTELLRSAQSAHPENNEVNPARPVKSLIERISGAAQDLLPPRQEDKARESDSQRHDASTGILPLPEDKSTTENVVFADDVPKDNIESDSGGGPTPKLSESISTAVIDTSTSPTVAKAETNEARTESPTESPVSAQGKGGNEEQASDEPHAPAVPAETSPEATVMTADATITVKEEHPEENVAEHPADRTVEGPGDNSDGSPAETTAPNEESRMKEDAMSAGDGISQMNSPQVRPSAHESAAPAQPFELAAQTPLKGQGDTGTGIATPIVAHVAALDSPTRERIEVATDEELPSMGSPEQKAEAGADSQGQALVPADGVADNQERMNVPEAPVLTDAVKDAVAVAEAVAADESMMETMNTEEALTTTHEDDGMGADDGPEPETVDEEGTQESAETPLRKTRQETDETKRAVMRRLLLSQDPASMFSAEKVIKTNVQLSHHTTFNMMESMAWGPPCPHPDKPINVYELDSKSLQVREILYDRQAKMNKKLDEKQARLRSQYKTLNNAWKEHCDRLDKAAELRESAVKSVTQPNTPSAVQPPLAEESQQPPLSASMVPTMGGRANRRGAGAQSGFGLGDAVRSEAEFLEILASLESADMQDPEARAARTATTVPDQKINPDGDNLLDSPMDDRNHFVSNPTAFYLDGFDPDFWSAEEKGVFARKYALWPKQFGRIAAALPNKTAKQCVYYYYLTKHQPGHDYKAITAARNRNQKRKGRLKPKKAKGSALMADLKSARGEEIADEDDRAASPIDNSAGRSRLLSGVGLGPGALGAVAEEDDASQPPPNAGVGSSRKRKAGGEDSSSIGDANGNEKRPKGGGRGGRRGKGQGRKSVAAAAAAAAAASANTSTDGTSGENELPSTTDSPVGASAEYESTDMDMAAAEALGALSKVTGTPQQQENSIEMSAGPALPSGMSGGKGKKRKVSGSVGDGSEDVNPQRKPRNTTSSYWSIQEKAEFLRALAVHGKEWSVVSSTLGAKSAAQARNYFARNAEVPEFAEAAQVAERNADQPLSVRQQLASEWSKERLSLTEEASRGLGLPHLAAGSGSATGASSVQSGVSPAVSKETSPEPPRRGGMGIMSLLNDEPATVKKKPSLNEWFGQSPRDSLDHQRTHMPSSDDSSDFAADRLGRRSYGEASSQDSDAEANRRAFPSHPTLPPRGTGSVSAEPRPYLPEARSINAAPSSRPPPPSLPSHYARGDGAPPNISISTTSDDARHHYSHDESMGEKDAYRPYSRSPVYDSRDHLRPLPPLSSNRSTSGGHVVERDSVGGYADSYGSRAVRSPAYDQDGHSANSHPYERASSASSMAPPPALSSQRHHSSWNNTSSVRSGSRDETAYQSSRPLLHSQSPGSASSYNRPSPNPLGSSSHHNLVPPSSRSMGPSPFPSPGQRTPSPSGHGQSVSSYMSARSSGHENVHRTASSSPYMHHPPAYGGGEDRRPGASASPSDSGMSVRPSALPPPPLPRPGSREGGDGYGVHRSSISAAAAAPPGPPRLPPPSSFMRQESSRSDSNAHHHEHEPRELPPPGPPSSRYPHYSNSSSREDKRWS
ncbi:unnamed protein product [Sympodiomycopsis kandeliae]